MFKKKGAIHSRVMAEISTRIEKAQEEHDETCRKLEEDHQTRVQTSRHQAEREKEACLERLVKQILP